MEELSFKGYNYYMNRAVRIITTTTIISLITLFSIYLLGTFLFCGLIRNASWCAWWPHIPIERLEDYIRASGPWGVVISIGVMVAHSFVPFPAEFVAIANGMIYGPLLGTLITWTGAMLGAFLAFGLARKLGYGYINRKLREKNRKKIQQWVKNNGGTAILVSRLIPVISFNLINYIAGLSNISVWTFFWTTSIGILPLTIIMVTMGSSISAASWKLWLIIAASGVVLLLISRLPFVKKLTKGL